MIYVVTDDLRRSNISGSVGEGLFGQYVPDKTPEKTLERFVVCHRGAKWMTNLSRNDSKKK